MQLGLFTPVFNRLSFDEMLNALKRYPQIEALELGTGCWPGSAHIDVERLLADSAAAKAYLGRLVDAGLHISALSCHGNPVHPQADIAQNDSAVLHKTIELAAKLGVRTVVCFSGCPGGSAQDVTPNWITAAWPPEFSEALQWQWAERLIPYWKDAARIAGDAGVRIALEAHPGYAVYNPYTLLKLRAATSDAIGINLDPSHLWWQGVDIPVAIRELGPAIHHFHAKDVAIDCTNRARNGVLDTRSYAEMANRAWLFRSVGCGHGELEWKSIIAALRLAGYDGVISIEHEDALASEHEGLSMAIAMLERAILREPPVEAWWT